MEQIALFAKLYLATLAILFILTPVLAATVGVYTGDGITSRFRKGAGTAWMNVCLNNVLMAIPLAGLVDIGWYQ
jgi:hypothetical protein